MPMAVKDIDKFEKLNGLIINVYGCTEDEREIYPRRISRGRDKKAINLPMIEWRGLSSCSDNELEQAVEY